MNNSRFRATYYRDGVSEVDKLLNELRQVGHIDSVENVINSMTSTVFIKFFDSRVTRIVYKKTFFDRLLGRSFI